MSIAPSALTGGGSAGKKEKPPLHQYGEKLSSTNLLTHIGINSVNHSGIHTIADNIVIVASGNLVLFVNYATGVIDSMVGPADGGVGAVAVHPSKNRFAYCEKSFNSPRVVVCDYPSKKETHVMKNGAEQGYAACAFNADGKLLATVATEPDYIITVWNWEQQAILLRNKAFSSDVFSVSFSPFSETMLVTSGMGHLKVWDMASTFTGLKLQGTVGKFGKVEISDIAGYIALPDGKVLSGSEVGSLLLWEASLVKCELMRIDDSPSDTLINGGSTNSATNNNDNGEPNNSDESHTQNSSQGGGGGGGEEEDDANNATMAAGLGTFSGIPTVNGRKLLKCHEGNIEVVKLIEDNKIVMTAGHDGFVRYWSFNEIDNCEPSGLTHIVGIKLLKEMFLGDGVKAKSVTISNDRTHWVLLDESGSLLTFPRWSYTYIISGDRFTSAPEAQSAPSGPLVEFFDGPISCLAACPNDRSVVVGGRDGTIRLFDTPNKHEIYRASFDDGVALLHFLPKAVDPAGLTLFCGFSNGVVRIIRKCRDGFEVLAAWRPHAAGLVGVALSADASQVYTAASDGTAFYSKLHISTDSAGDQIYTPEPYGWCTIPDKVAPTALEWSAEGDVCFFGFASGMMLAVKPPTEKPNHDETFEFPISYSGVGYRQKKKPPQKEKKLVLNPNDHQDESSSDEDEEDEDQGPWGINQIKRLPNGKGYVVIMDKEELGYVYMLSIRYEGKLGPPPIPPTGVDPPGRVEEPGANIAFRNLIPVGVSVSSNEKWLLVAFSHGEVIKRPIDDLANTKAPVSHARQYHDSVDGRVTGAATLFDDSALVTVGSDGLIITHSIEGTEPPTGKVNLVALPKCDPAKRQGKDRKRGVVANSVEAQRRLEDKEAAEALAEGKRSIIKKKIAAVHKEYIDILSQNDAAVGGQKLSEAELTLDPELLRLLELEKANRVEEASVEFSWRIAYKEQLLKQLRAAFVDTMTYDRFVVKSFDDSFSVASIRTPAFTPEQQEKLELLKQAIQHNLGITPSSSATLLNAGDGHSTSPLGITLDQVPSDSNANSGVGLEHKMRNEGGGALLMIGEEGGEGSGSQHRRLNNYEDEEAYNNINSNADEEMGPPAADGSHPHNPHQTLNGTTASGKNDMNDTLGRNKALKSQLEKAEERKRERQERKKGLEELLARKPKPTDVDPVLEAEMRYAREHMGDKILKTAPEYRVPANLVPTAERKAKQLILLEHSTNCLRAAFNEKLLALRDLKKTVCAELNEDRKRLAEIIAILALDERELPPVFDLHPEEEPEKRFDISEPALRKWAKEKAREQRKLEAQQRATKGFGADLANAEDDKASYDSEDSDEGAGEAVGGQKRVSRLSGGHRESTFARKPSLLSLKEKLEMDLKSRLENVRMSDLEEEEAIIQRETLLYEKGRLVRRLEAAKKSYNDKLLEFLQERTRLEADICMADMRALLLYREFRMLLGFKKKDEELEANHEAKLAEQSRINAKIKAITADIEATKERQIKVNEGFVTNRADADMHIKTSFPLQDQPYLLEVFNRKIKRVKVTDNNEDDDDAPTSSEDEEEDTTGDDFVEVKPPTCDEAPWQHLLQLREGRLDLEDAQASLKQKFNEFEKLLVKVKDKERQKVEKELAESRKAIEDFQLEKQRQLNLLETIVVLKLSQIQCLSDDKKVPHDLQKAPVIVFTETAINGLRSRIAELAEEKHELARKAVQLSRAKQALLRRKSKRQLEHSEWEQRVNEVQLLKFGQKIDLEALENLAVDRETEELKQQLKIEEIKWERELRKQENRVKSLRHDNQSRIAENTMLLKDLGNVRAEQQVLEHALTTSTQKIINKMAGGSKVATAADRAQLKDLVVRQQQELDMLNNEITMLKRKGGHVYTPVIQRLQQQQQQQAFSSSLPTGTAATSSTPPQTGLNQSYSHVNRSPVGADTHQQLPSSAPSSQQLANGLTGQRISGGARNNNIVVRPTVLSQSARGPTSTKRTDSRSNPSARAREGTGSPSPPETESPQSPEISPENKGEVEESPQ